MSEDQRQAAVGVDPSEQARGDTATAGRASTKGLKLSVVIPVYNEREFVAELIERVLRTPFEKEVIIVDDCSRDGTYDILKPYDGKRGVRIFHHEVNQGKGAALRTGFE